MNLTLIHSANVCEAPTRCLQGEDHEWDQVPAHGPASLWTGSPLCLYQLPSPGTQWVLSEDSFSFPHQREDSKLFLSDASSHIFRGSKASDYTVQWEVHEQIPLTCSKSIPSLFRKLETTCLSGKTWCPLHSSAVNLFEGTTLELLIFSSNYNHPSHC